jgi:hypothetical protein
VRPNASLAWLLINELVAILAYVFATVGCPPRTESPLRKPEPFKISEEGETTYVVEELKMGV